MLKIGEVIPAGESIGVGVNRRVLLTDEIVLGRAAARIRQMRPHILRDGSIEWEEIGETEEVHNLITNAGRDFLHLQGYGTSGLGANGLNYVALSNDTVTETATSTVLSNEIAANGLSRAQGAYAHTPGVNTTTIDKTFTASGSQSCQKAALFTASSAGTMNHVLGFTQRSLVSPDTIQITFTITLG